MKQAENKKTAEKPAKKNLAVWIAGIICALVVIGIVLFLVLGDLLGALLSLRRMNNALEKAVDRGATVVVTEQGFFTDSISQTATATLTGGDAEELVEDLADLTSDLRYVEKRSVGYGGLDRMISVRYGDRVLTLYMTESELYFSSGANSFAVFVPEADEQDDYNELYEELTVHLRQSRTE